ncbi:MAG: HAD hydrolase-like protein, partial [Candidatus Obscuribacterales bacterium]|nr:HAD hydrolase-like protein [Candidatus Obscuribacterales bacterium]
MYKLAIFDFDGTLVDSAPGIIDVMIQVSDYYGFPQSVVEHWKQLIGVPLNNQSEIILPSSDKKFQD